MEEEAAERHIMSASSVVSRALVMLLLISSTGTYVGTQWAFLSKQILQM